VTPTQGAESSELCDREFGDRVRASFARQRLMRTLGAEGERFFAVGRVLRSGRILTVCSGEVYAVQGVSRKLICAMQATMIASRTPNSGA
jgi:hypothetical protein